MRAVNLLPRQQVQQKREAAEPGRPRRRHRWRRRPARPRRRILARQPQRRPSAAGALRRAGRARRHSRAPPLGETQAFRQSLLTQREQRCTRPRLGDRQARRVGSHSPPLRARPSERCLAHEPDRDRAARLRHCYDRDYDERGIANPRRPPLTIVGYTYSQASVARLLARLQCSPISRTSSSEQPDGTVGGQNVISFTIVSDIRQGRDAS